MGGNLAMPWRASRHRDEELARVTGGCGRAGGFSDTLGLKPAFHRKPSSRKVFPEQPRMRRSP
jgi:hypothetical protein